MKRTLTLLLLLTLALAACGDMTQPDPAGATSAAPILVPPSTLYVASNGDRRFPWDRGWDSLCTVTNLTGVNANGALVWPPANENHYRNGGALGLSFLGFTSEWPSPAPILTARPWVNQGVGSGNGSASATARCYPWTSFENLGFNPPHQMTQNGDGEKYGLVYIPNDASGTVLTTIDRALWEGDTFCYLAGVGHQGHTSEEAFLWQQTGPYANGFRWVIRLVGKTASVAEAHCVDLGRDVWTLGIQNAYPGQPAYTSFTPEEAVCMPTGIWGAIDRGGVSVTVGSDGVIRGNISGEVRFGQFACLSYYDPQGVTLPLKKAELEARMAAHENSLE